MNAPLPRLDGGPEMATPAAKARSLVRQCLECGNRFTTLRPTQDFCCDLHKKEFNNRRGVRGAALYDLFMSLRYDRDLSKTLKVMTILYRLAAEFRDEDNRERAGRLSWRKPAVVLERFPHLQAVATDIRRPKR